MLDINMNALNIRTVRQFIDQHIDQSSLTNSDDVNKKCANQLNAIRMSFTEKFPVEEMSMTEKLIFDVIIYLSNSYMSALHNDWSECDYQHSLALINYEILCSLGV